jgi:hypothetical protein
VAILTPTGDLSIEEVAKKDVPAGVAYTIVNDEDVPSDRTFRNAWKHDLTVDFPKAQALTKDRLRHDRTPLLEAQDVLFQRALETGQNATAIVKEKQRLRDVTKLVDTATTLDALKNMGVA